MKLRAGMKFHASMSFMLLTCNHRLETYLGTGHGNYSIVERELLSALFYVLTPNPPLPL